MRLQLRALPWLLCLVTTVTSAGLEPVPDKTVVLTFDDAVKSHATFVGPLLKEYGFGATFFVTALWMSDTENFMSWEDIRALHEMGFEIGNHSWSHPNFGSPRTAGHLAGQLALVENELKRVGVPKPISFAWCGNSFSTEGVEVLREAGYQLARRGMQPEIPYGKIEPGPLFEPGRYHPLLIPSAGDAYPQWDLDAFKRVVDRARNGTIAVVQFHGVPDVAHPWVHTPPDRFREYMRYLKRRRFNVIAMRDLLKYVDPNLKTNDPMASVRYTGAMLELPAEVTSTRAEPEYWLRNMIGNHGYSEAEAARVFAFPEDVLHGKIASGEFDTASVPRPAGKSTVLPYPGGRHPRIGFLEGAIDPLRGTKASVFTPWGGYVVVDLPEAVFSNLGLMFLAHTHVPTIWDAQHRTIDNMDWARLDGGALSSQWALPNGVSFGARVTPAANGADLELWLENGTPEALIKMRTQICVMLKGAPGFAAQTQENKTYRDDTAVARSDDGKRWVLVQFDHCGRTWGNERCPCIHADPVLPDAQPGERVAVTGRVWFYEGDDVGKAIAARPSD